MCRETMDDSLVSVVVPVYKVEKYLEKCINSLLDQSYPNYEIILVDDGSPDNCPQICDTYSRQYENIRVVHKKNGGLSSARNAGVENARGRWIVFVDSDDFVECDYISYMWEIKNKYSSDFVVCGVTDEDEHGNYLGSNGNSSCEVMNPKDAFFSIYFGRNACFQAYSKLIDKDILEHNPFPDGYYEDFATTYLWIDAAKRIVLGDGSGNYHYIQRDGGILKRKLTKDHLHCFEICDEITAYVGRKYPEFEKYNYLLYQKQVVQMLNKQKLTKKQLGDVFDRYKRMFRKNALRRVFDKNVGVKTRAYTVLLSTNPCVYILSVKLIGNVRNLILAFKQWKSNVKELDTEMNKKINRGGYRPN